MSANQALQMEFIISNSSLKKLEKVMNGGGSGGTAKTGILQSLNKGSIGSLMKLGGIFLGVTGIASVVQKIGSLLVDASPMLSAMMKLFSMSVMLILRPIGDFIGFFLKPFLFAFLRKAIDIYKFLEPIAKKLGVSGGNQLAEHLGFGDPANTSGIVQAATVGGGIAGAIQGAITGAAIGSVVPVVGTLVGAIGGAIVGAIGGAVVGAAIGEGLEYISDKLTGAYLMFKDEFVKTIEFLAPLLFGALQGIGDALGKAKEAWDNWVAGLNLPTLEQLTTDWNNWIKGLNLPTIEQLTTDWNNWIKGLNLPTIEQLTTDWNNWIKGLNLPTLDDLKIAWDKFMTDIGTIFANAGTAITGVLNVFSTGLTTIYTGSITALTGIYDLFKTGATNAITNITNGLSALWTTLIQPIVTFFTTLVVPQSVLDAFNSFKSFISTLEIGDGIKALVKGFLDLIKAIADFFGGIGKSVGELFGIKFPGQSNNNNNSNSNKQSDPLKIVFDVLSTSAGTGAKALGIDDVLRVVHDALRQARPK